MACGYRLEEDSSKDELKFENEKGIYWIVFKEQKQDSNLVISRGRNNCEGILCGRRYFLLGNTCQSCQFPYLWFCDNWQNWNAITDLRLKIQIKNKTNGFGSYLPLLWRNLMKRIRKERGCIYCSFGISMKKSFKNLVSHNHLDYEMNERLQISWLNRCARHSWVDVTHRTEAFDIFANQEQQYIDWVMSKFKTFSFVEEEQTRNYSKLGKNPQLQRCRWEYSTHLM